MFETATPPVFDSDHDYALSKILATAQDFCNKNALAPYRKPITSSLASLLVRRFMNQKAKQLDWPFSFAETRRRLMFLDRNTDSQMALSVGSDSKIQKNRLRRSPKFISSSSKQDYYPTSLLSESGQSLRKSLFVDHPLINLEEETRDLNLAVISFVDSSTDDVQMCPDEQVVFRSAREIQERQVEYYSVMSSQENESKGKSEFKSKNRVEDNDDGMLEVVGNQCELRPLDLDFDHTKQAENSMMEVDKMAQCTTPTNTCASKGDFMFGVRFDDTVDVYSDSDEDEYTWDQMMPNN
ncbi:hypothetical protein HK098_002430 [Nowakowskiella sp. JEL0407]|nr:hypothetical protein HK098_002430 [Nowakowskiella sp. JEL0407]